jgi:catechol 2,3-dioxygenase-like lactoylglutathione lyase family enzyme
MTGPVRLGVGGKPPRPARLVSLVKPAIAQEVSMLGAKNVIATLAVKDIDAARHFYENTLGLTQVEGGTADPSAVVYGSGSSAVLVYQSRYAGTNQATAASWAVGEELDAIVQGLKEKGVTFERYDDLPGTTRDGDVHVMGELKAVWFKDPDGNILNLVNQSM